MTTNIKSFISFEPKEGKFSAFLPMETAIEREGNLESELSKLTKIYEDSIDEMRFILKKIQEARINKKPVPAYLIWRLGNKIFLLTNKLESLSFQLDGLYNHLVRDLGVKRKWLEKVIIFRRYVPNENIIPRLINWGVFEKGTRRKAEQLINDSTHVRNNG